MSEIKTMRVYPTRAERLDGVPSVHWQNPEAVILRNGIARREIGAGRNQSTPGFQSFVFETTVPTFAKIVGGRMITDARIADDTAPRIQIARYSFRWLEGQARSNSWTNIAPRNWHGPTFEVVKGEFTPLLVDFFNGKAINGPTSPGVRNLFEVEIRLYRDEILPVDSWAEIREFAFEFDYTTPPAPWKGRIHIQGKPMQTQAIKQGSNRPFVQVSVTDANGDPLDLRGATLTLKAVSSQKTIEGEVTLTDAANGKGIYEWRDGDTDTPGVYRVELTSEWLDGSVVKIPHDRMMLFEVVPSL